MSQYIEITDFHAPELDIYARLKEAQLLHLNEPREGLFLAESPMVIERALDAGYLPLSFLAEISIVNQYSHSIFERCPEAPVYVAELPILTRLTGFNLTRGMLCAMYRKPLPTVEEICSFARRIVVLEDVVNPTNVGAIFRCAAALNMDAVLLTPACTNPLYRRAIRVSMGTVFQLPWTFLNKKDTASVSGIRLLHQLGFQTAAMALTNASVSIDKLQLAPHDRLAVVLGTEGEGLSPDTIAACDYTIRIPMSHGVDSLNVAAAAAIAFWQFGNREL